MSVNKPSLKILVHFASTVQSSSDQDDFGFADDSVSVFVSVSFFFFCFCFFNVEFDLNAKSSHVANLLHILTANLIISYGFYTASYQPKNRRQLNMTNLD
jgi:hypothetical protein